MTRSTLDTTDSRAQFASAASSSGDATTGSSTAPIPSMPGWRPLVFTGALIAMLVVAAALAFTFRMRALDAHLRALVLRVNDIHRELGRTARDRDKWEDLESLRRELPPKRLDLLRSAVDNIPDEMEKRNPRISSPSRSDYDGPPASRPAVAAPPYDAYVERRVPDDPVRQLLTIANRVVQESATTLDAFRASTAALGAYVSAWPSTADGTPAAFIVEYPGSCYAVPNVVKPTRLPQEWFNRSEFGVNDEIQRVESLPRLRRRGFDEFDVQQPGVFKR